MNKLNVVLSKEMEKVLDKAQRNFGINKEETLKKAFALLDIYTTEKSQNNDFVVCDKQGEKLKIIK